MGPPSVEFDERVDFYIQIKHPMVVSYFPIIVYIIPSRNPVLH